jgi:hypothetical protein
MRTSVLKSDLALVLLLPMLVLEKRDHAQWRNAVVNAYSQGRAYPDVVKTCMDETRAFKTNMSERKIYS